MTAQDYEVWTRPLRRHPSLTKALLCINKVLTLLVYLAYPLLLLALLLQKDARLATVFLTPAISFVLVSVFRDRVNMPRPYEQLDIRPLIHKDTRGHSFPSRHVFSSAVISCAFLYTVPCLGAIGFPMRRSVHPPAKASDCPQLRGQSLRAGTDRRTSDSGRTPCGHPVQLFPAPLPPVRGVLFCARRNFLHRMHSIFCENMINLKKQEFHHLVRNRKRKIA